MCCKSRSGACGGCKRNGRSKSGVLAYVSAFGGRNGVKESSTHIRICPLAFEMKNDAGVLPLGMTMFHEVMHITSAAGDKGYSKKECFANARNDPAKARLNA